MARIKCSLVLSGKTLDPPEVSRRGGIVPTLAWKKGDFIRPSTRRRPDNGWKISVEEANSDALEHVLGKLLDLLRPKQAIFKSIVEQSGCDAEFACAVYLNDSSPVPSMHLDRAAIAILSEYKAELDIDVYPNPAEPWNP